MPESPRSLPLLGHRPVERQDAARNREAVFAAGRELVERYGAAGVTMEAVAERAGVGKGTVFRRFGSREGLMTSLLDDAERAWQASVISGPPPLGPGAPAWDRLAAFGRSRLTTTLANADLIRAAGAFGTRSRPAHAFVAMHLRHLLTGLDAGGDPAMLVAALLAPLEAPLADPDLDVEHYPVDEVVEAWLDLAARVVRRPLTPPGGARGRR